MTVDEMEREYEKSKALFHKIVESDDAISRQAVLDIVNNPLNIRLDEIIKKLPSVTQKTGKWIEEKHDYWIIGYRCSKCNWMYDYNSIKYCPNCGAKMESEDKEC